MGFDAAGPDPAPALTAPIYSGKFIFLLAAIFLAYANISVFFQFYGYLKTLPIAPEWYGLLIGAFSAVSLLVRPLVSPFCHAGNARRFLWIGTAAAICALAAYSLAESFWSLLAVRLFHGLAFVVLGTALMTLAVGYIPKDHSAQFFGMLAIVILIPNTIIPPFLPLLLDVFGGFPRVLLFFSAVIVLIFPLVSRAGNPDQFLAGQPEARRLSWADVLEDLKNPSVYQLLFAMLLLYSGYGLVFFFLDGYGRSLGIGHTGVFLTLATVGEISVRLAGGSFFDRIEKTRLLAGTLVGLACGYLLLARVPGETVFFCLGAVLGLGWGIAMPVFNGLMFDVSQPRFQAFNTNLGMQMFQGGFFIGPFAGGAVVARWGFSPLFFMCAVLSLLAAGLVLAMGRKRQG